MDAGIYTRLSAAKDSQEATTDAIDRQEARCRAMAEAKSWTVIEHYSDVDIGAFRRAGQRKPPARPGFERMLVDVESGRIQGIIFYRLDRLVRDHGDFERVLTICEAHGAKLASPVDAVDTSTPTGEAMARTMVTFARLESATTALRIAAQKEQRARAGKPLVTGHRAYGYDWDGETIIQEEARWIRVAAEGLIAGQSLHEVTRTLNDGGSRGTRGRPWNTVRLKVVLCSARVAGLRSYKGEVVAKGTWPAILDMETWQAVRAVLTDSKRGTNLPGRPRRWLLAGGLARCGHPDCGAQLQARAGGDGQVRYVCAKGPGRPGCGRITIVAERLHEIVEQMLFARDWRHLELPPDEGPDEGELAAALAEDEALLIELSRLHSARPQRISTPEWLVQRDEVATRIAKARELQAERRQRTATAETATGGKALQEQWPGLTLEQKRAAFQRVLTCVIVNPAKPGASRVDPDRVVPVWRA